MDKTDAPVGMPAQEKTSLLEKAVRLFAFPIAGISGLWAGHVSLRSSTKNTAKDFGVFARIDKERIPVSTATTMKRLAGETSVAEFLAEDAANKAEYTRQVGVELEKLGLNKTANQWKYVSQISKQRAVIEGMTVAGIAVGALLTITESKLLSRMFTHNKDQEGQNR